MSTDKYGTRQDPYCYPGTPILRNILDLQDQTQLDEAEKLLSSIAANELEFSPPPYDLTNLCQIHHHLFSDLYGWAGEIRTIDISKGGTRFCTVNRIATEADKVTQALAGKHWLVGMNRGELINCAAQSFGDWNVIHPFREGNGRALRLLYENIIVNAGYQIDWTPIGQNEWLAANIAAVSCNYRELEAIFGKCISDLIEDA